MKRALALCLSLVVAVGCERPSVTSPKSPGISAAIVDGAHGSGNSHFFFLPPMVKPVVPPPFSGTFNPSLGPVVQICQSAAADVTGACPASSTIASFPTLTGPFNPFRVFQRVQVVPTLQFYFVLWRPNWFTPGPTQLDPSVIYRIAVVVGSNVLGIADVQVVTSEDQFEQVWNAGAFVPLPKGAPTLPIIFRIEQQALCAGGADCIEATVGAAAQDVITPSLRAAVHLDAGSFSQNVELVIKKVVTGEGVSCHTTNLQQFDDCYNISVTPNTVLNVAARVEICLNLLNTLPLTVAKHPELVRSEPGVPGVVELAGVPHRLITCPGYPTFPSLGSPIGVTRHSLWDVASAGLRLVRGLLQPQQLHAASRASLMIDEGLGGVVPPGLAFSNYGYVLLARVRIVSVNPQAAIAGTPVLTTPTVIVECVHPSTSCPVGLGGMPVTFSVASGSGTLSGGVSTITVLTGPDGTASTPWTLGATAGTNSLTASAPATGSPVTFTATGVVPTTLIDCGAGVGGDEISRGFYVLSFPETRLDRVTLYMSARTAGTYTFSLTARANGYAGTLLGIASATVTLTANDQANVATVFTFPSPTVTQGSTVTFTIVQTAGPAGAQVFYAVPGALPTGDPNCPVVETEGTSPPLDTFRRQGVNVKIEGGGGGIL